MYYDDNTIVFLNGSFVKAKEATVSLYTQTLHYGNGVFEGVRSYNTPSGARIFRAKEHYDRLHYSAEKMLLPLPYSTDEMIDATYQVLAANKLTDAYIRPLVYSNEVMSIAPDGGSNFFTAAWEWGRYLGDRTPTTCISPFVRPNPGAFFVEAKISGQYVNSIFTTMHARRNGFDEAIVLDQEGNVAEGPGANIFIEKDGAIFTPPRGHILPGITRSAILELASGLGIPASEKTITPDELRSADAAFFCGTAAEIIQIASVDKRNFPLPLKETAAAKLSVAFQELVRG